MTGTGCVGVWECGDIGAKLNRKPALGTGSKSWF
jgi:hypothetical protein